MKGSLRTFFGAQASHCLCLGCVPWLFHRILRVAGKCNSMAWVHGPSASVRPPTKHAASPAKVAATPAW